MFQEFFWDMWVELNLNDSMILMGSDVFWGIQGTTGKTNLIAIECHSWVSKV